MTSSIRELIAQLDDLHMQRVQIETQESHVLLLLKEACKHAPRWTIGQKVRIINKVTFPGDRIATITSVSEHRIGLLMDNGIKTWRAPKNLMKLLS